MLQPGNEDISLETLIEPKLYARLISEIGEDVALFLDEGNGEMVDALSDMADVDPLPTRVLKICAFGRRAAPRDEFGSRGRVMEPQRLSETVRNAINALAGDYRPEAGKALADFANNSELTGWRPSIRHAQANKAD